MGVGSEGGAAAPPQDYGCSTAISAAYGLNEVLRLQTSKDGHKCGQEATPERFQKSF